MWRHKRPKRSSTSWTLLFHSTIAVSRYRGPLHQRLYPIPYHMEQQMAKGKFFRTREPDWSSGFGWLTSSQRLEFNPDLLTFSYFAPVAPQITREPPILPPNKASCRMRILIDTSSCLGSALEILRTGRNIRSSRLVDHLSRLSNR